MKPLNFLLFTIISLGGGSEAAPSGATLRNRTVNSQFNARDAHPVLTTSVLAPQATSYQFYTSQGWQDDKDVKANPAAAAVLGKMHVVGLFTAVVLKDTHSSIVGTGGLTTPTEWIKSTEPNNVLITNGGFFIPPNAKGMIDDFKGGKPGNPLPVPKFGGFSVGPTSLTKNIVGVPSVYTDLYQRYTADDGTYLECAPSLKTPVDETIPPEALANTDAGRLQYFLHDDKGDYILDPKGNREPSMFSHVAGTGVCTVNEQNERMVLVIVDEGTKVVFGYNSIRKNGMKMNQLRDLIGVFFQGYLPGKTIETVKQSLALDGGGSTYIGWVGKDGETKVLAAGNLPNDPTQFPGNWMAREVTTLVKHSVPLPPRGPKKPTNRAR